MENNRYREEEKELEELEKEETKTPDKDNVGEDIKTSDGKDEESLEKGKGEAVDLEEIEALREENEKLIEENADLKDQLLRERAELENFKKRMVEERARDRKYALTDFLMELIDLVDIFDKAVNIKTEDEKIKKFLSGFVMVNKTFKQILENNGVTKIEALGKPFDPAYHSAIETVSVEGTKSNIVVEEIMTGYTYKDRILRPSMVKVSE